MRYAKVTIVGRHGGVKYLFVRAKSLNAAKEEAMSMLRPLGSKKKSRIGYFAISVQRCRRKDAIILREVRDYGFTYNPYESFIKAIDEFKSCRHYLTAKQVYNLIKQQRHGKY